MTDENQRLVSFSDGVIAITITLMAFEIRLPDGGGPWTDATLWQALIELAPQARAYVLSFLVVGIFWLGHRSKFTHIRRHSTTLAWLNLLFLLEIGFMPFVTDALAQSGGSLAAVLYAVTVSIISLTSGIITLYAVRSGLSDAEPAQAYRMAWPIVAPALVFCLSIPLALISAEYAQLFWLLLIPASIMAGRFSRSNATIDG